MHHANSFRATAVAAIIVCACATAGASTSMYYTTNQAGPAACLTAEAYEQYTDAAIYARRTRDASRMAWLYNSEQCVRMKKGVKATLVDAGLNVSQIRIYAPSGEPLLLWTATENIARRGSLSPFDRFRPNLDGILHTVSLAVVCLAVFGIFTALLFAILPVLGFAFLGVSWLALIFFSGSTWGFFGVLFSIAIPAGIVYAVIAYMDARDNRTLKRPYKLKVRESSLRFHESSVRSARTHRRHTPWQEL